MRLARAIAVGLAALIVCLWLPGCNTIHGFGRDLQNWSETRDK
jgi:predicted small secreted protein